MAWLPCRMNDDGYRMAREVMRLDPQCCYMDQDSLNDVIATMRMEKHYASMRCKYYCANLVSQHLVYR